MHNDSECSSPKRVRFDFELKDSVENWTSGGMASFHYPPLDTGATLQPKGSGYWPPGRHNLDTEVDTFLLPHGRPPRSGNEVTSGKKNRGRTLQRTMKASRICPIPCTSRSDSSSDDLELDDYLELVRLMPFRRFSAPRTGSSDKSEQPHRRQKYANGISTKRNSRASAAESPKDALLEYGDDETTAEGKLIIKYVIEIAKDMLTRRNNCFFIVNLVESTKDRLLFCHTPYSYRELFITELYYRNSWMANLAWKY